MTVSVSDAAQLLRTISDHPVARACDPAAWPSVKPLRIGVVPPKSVCSCAVEPEVAASVEAAIEVLRSLAASVVPATMPSANHLAALIDAEAYEHFAPYVQASRDAFDPRIRAHLKLDESRPAVDLGELRAALGAFRKEVGKAFSEFDVLWLPRRYRPCPSESATRKPRSPWDIALLNPTSEGCLRSQCRADIPPTACQ